MPDDTDGLDRELRSRFARLREEERLMAGSSRVAARRSAERPRSPDRRRYRIPATLAAAAVIVVAVLSLVDRQSPATRIVLERATGNWTSALEPSSLGIGSASRIPLQLAWATPTDVLLDTPGRALLRDIPSIGLSSLGTLIGSPPRRPDRGRTSADTVPSRAATPRSPT